MTDNWFGGVPRCMFDISQSQFISALQASRLEVLVLSWLLCLVALEWEKLWVQCLRVFAKFEASVQSWLTWWEQLHWLSCVTDICLWQTLDITSILDIPPSQEETLTHLLVWVPWEGPWHCRGWWSWHMSVWLVSPAKHNDLLWHRDRPYGYVDLRSWSPSPSTHRLHCLHFLPYLVSPPLVPCFSMILCCLLGDKCIFDSRQHWYARQSPCSSQIHHWPAVPTFQMFGCNACVHSAIGTLWCGLLVWNCWWS